MIVTTETRTLARWNEIAILTIIITKFRLRHRHHHNSYYKKLNYRICAMCNGETDPLKHATPHIMQNLVVLRQRAWALVGDYSTNVALWAPREAYLSSYKFAPPHVGYRAEFDRCFWSTVRAYLWTSAGKTGFHASCLSRSLKVIGTDTDRFGTHDFLLTFHSNQGSIITVF